MKKKKCSKCKKIKSTLEFYKSKRAKDGLSWCCKNCQRAYEQSNKGKKIKRKYNRTEKGKFNIRNKKLKQKYGISLEGYDILLKQQGGVCAICGRINVNGQRLAVDHNHLTNEIRGLLCTGCNWRLGVLENNEFVSKAKTYLKSNA